jgi:hypothetical protein
MESAQDETVYTRARRRSLLWRWQAARRTFSSARSRPCSLHRSLFITMHSRPQLSTHLSLSAPVSA